MGGQPQRISIPDSRGHGASLQVTRHPSQRKIVLSHWRDGRCVASTPIELGEVSALIGVLADALGEAIEQAGPFSAGVPVRPTLMARVRHWVSPRLAQVTELRLVREAKDPPEP